MTQLFNQKGKTKLRQKLRKELSVCELKIWYFLRNRQIRGVKFRRQVSIKNIVVDFYSPEMALVLEIDGDSHYTNKDAILKDKEREDYLKGLGLSVLRFTNVDVMQNIEGCINKIFEVIDQLKLKS
jgi:very-short-patch-repair endonuclease